MSHYFENPQGKKVEETFVAELLGKQFTFLSASGMFSVGELDRGTQLLVEYADLNDAKNCLDLGCAYGIVGIAIAKYYAIPVLLTDVNKRAIGYAKKNIVANKVEQLATAKLSDGFAGIDQHFDCILFNPPQHAGKQLCLDLINQSYQHLNPGGSLHIVARHNKGGASFEKHMTQFGQVETLCKKSGFRVYKVKK